MSFFAENASAKATMERQLVELEKSLKKLSADYSRPNKDIQTRCRYPARRDSVRQSQRDALSYGRETFSTPALSASILSAMSTPLLQRQSMRAFLAAIFLTGILRFVLTVAGLPNSIVKFVSMTVVMMIATVYFAVVTETHKERLKSAFLIVLPYMIIELGALGYTWGSGHQTIFHAQEYSFGTPISYHFIGHLVGGLTWEPISIFLVMEIIWLILWPFRRTPKPAPELR